MTSSSASQPCLPCVVQVGFAGARQLPLSAKQSEIVVELLGKILKELPRDKALGLQPHHFLCGISALAIGADSLFTQACSRMRIPQRIFLPQTRDVFLEAIGSKGADFNPAQKREAERLLALPHIIQERVVSAASNRADRFAETNREINRVSSVVICMNLAQASATGKPGGTQDLLELARSAGRPVLELKLDLSQAEPRFEKLWHLPVTPHHPWQPPELPEEVARLPAPPTSPDQPLPTVGAFCRAVKAHSSGEAAKHRYRFTRAALVVVGTHLLATFLATLVLVLHGAHGSSAPHPAATAHGGPESLLPVLIGLLVVELMALGWGFYTHQRLHHSGSHSAAPGPTQTHLGGLTHAWALARLLAEINRSVSSLEGLHIYLEYLFQLHLPSRLRHLLRTINVLHLATTPKSSRPWDELRNTYVSERLDAQRHYFQDRASRAASWLKWAKFLFAAFSGAAIVATALKLTVFFVVWRTAYEDEPALTGILGFFAVTFPAVAVGVMSLVAALDFEAQNHIYREMAQWLADQKRRIQRATSRQEFQQLAQETESRLLGETAEWYSRRSFTGVS